MGRAPKVHFDVSVVLRDVKMQSTLVLLNSRVQYHFVTGQGSGE